MFDALDEVIIAACLGLVIVLFAAAWHWIASVPPGLDQPEESDEEWIRRMMRGEE